MSLIRVRRRRKKDAVAARTGMSSGRLIALFLMVVALIWYLGWAF